jgi:hypothetical protein
MEFPAILLPSEQVAQEKLNGNGKENGKEPDYPVPASKSLKLWGLSLGMTLDLISYMIPPNPNSSPSALPTANNAISLPSSSPSDGFQRPGQQISSDFPFHMEHLAPSLTSVFPRFSYPDVNFWIWYALLVLLSLLHLISFLQGIRKTLPSSHPRLGSIYTRRRDERQTDKLVWLCTFIVLCGDQEGTRRCDRSQGVGAVVRTGFCGLVGVFLSRFSLFSDTHGMGSLYAMHTSLSPFPPVDM